MDKKYEQSESDTMDKSTCKTNCITIIITLPIGEIAQRLANCMLWSVEQLVTRRGNTGGLPSRPELLLTGTVSVVPLKADAPAETTRLWPATLVALTMCTGILALWLTGILNWAGPHHAWGAQTVCLLLVKAWSQCQQNHSRSHHSYNSLLCLAWQKMNSSVVFWIHHLNK